jgi:hypothetical protein
VLTLFIIRSVVFFLPPKADQVITKENAEKIHEGMSPAEVISLLGREPDSKYHYGESPHDEHQWWWNRRTLDPSNDPDMLIRGSIIVEFDGNQKVKLTCYKSDRVEKSWFDSIRAELGF